MKYFIIATVILLTNAILATPDTTVYYQVLAALMVFEGFKE